MSSHTEEMINELIRKISSLDKKIAGRDKIEMILALYEIVNDLSGIETPLSEANNG